MESSPVRGGGPAAGRWRGPTFPPLRPWAPSTIPLRFMLINLTFLALRVGEYERARGLAMQGLHLALEMNNKLDIADSLAGLAGVLGVTGQPQHAARLLGAWEAAFEWMGATVLPSAKREHDHTIAAVRAQLDNTAFTAAWNEGRAMSLQQTVESALQESDL